MEYLTNEQIHEYLKERRLMRKFARYLKMTFNGLLVRLRITDDKYNLSVCFDKFNKEREKENEQRRNKTTNKVY